MPGRLFAVVGPSGAGKDSLMLAAAQRRPDIQIARRVITRPEEAGGEPFEGVSEAEFLTRLRAGAFALNWQAHGLRYGIPASIEAALAKDQDVVFNGSRAILPVAAEKYPDLRVIHVTARPEILARRLASRGRETADDIQRRLARTAYGLPAGLPQFEVPNNGELSEAVTRFLLVFDPARTAAGS